jgi:O-antigen/teichoic acid export membrane protein
VIFTTFTLFRAPLTLIYSLQGRVLSFLVRSNGSGADIHRMVRRIATFGTTLAAVAGLVGWSAGPLVVEILFGTDFRPEPLVAALVAAGVVMASATQLMGQALVAAGSTGQLASAWVGGLAIGLATMLVSGGTPGFRVCLGFVVGEVAAFGFALTRTIRHS